MGTGVSSSRGYLNFPTHRLIPRHGVDQKEVKVLSQNLTSFVLIPFSPMTSGGRPSQLWPASVARGYDIEAVYPLHYPERLGQVLEVMEVAGSNGHLIMEHLFFPIHPVAEVGVGDVME